MKQSVHCTRVICVLTIFFLFVNTLLLAQAPHKMSYQAVIRDTDGELVTNSNIGMQASILQGSPEGTAVFVELHFATTNDNGLVSIEIGDGTPVTGSMEEINWAEGPYFIHTETDLLGDANYTLAHTSELLSVPYALHSQTAETLSEEIIETDPVFLDSPAAGILLEDIDNWDEAFSWGDHDGLYRFNDWTPGWEDMPEGAHPGDMRYWDGNNWLAIEPGEQGQTLTWCNGVPIWGPCLDNGDPDGTVTDIDGNVYQTVIIGNQEWMAENLRVTKYNNGVAIPTGLNSADWSNTTDGAYTIFDHNHSGADGINSPEEMVDAYGKLYNWHAVDDPRGLCPEGWSAPSDADWTQLVNYVVAQGFPNSTVTNSAGNALKSCRQIGSPLGGECNTSAHPRWSSHGTHHGFDEFGFSALPGGARWSHGGFGHIGGSGYWWSSNEDSSADAWSRYMRSYLGTVYPDDDDKRVGFSVRCFREQDN